MTLFTDSTYLRDEQYKTSANLNARAELHRRFSTNPYGWMRWAFDQIEPHLNGQALEVGGGPGWLWRECLERVPARARVVVSDFSLGMVREARAALGHDPRFAFANLDAQALPVPAGAYRLVVANHMLFHVPDMPRAVREFARVLAPVGVLCAATNGSRHMREMYLLLNEYAPGELIDQGVLPFRLETAEAVLAPAFARVEVRRYDDALWVTDAQALADYVLSSSVLVGVVGADRVHGLRDFFQSKIDLAGGLRLTKDAGMAVAYSE